MSKFEVLCVTMNQKDFSKVREMNIQTNVVFANQADKMSFEYQEFEGFSAKMITTPTRGVGINRNIALMNASAEICLLADDDVVYDDEMVKKVTTEFEMYPQADVIIFHLTSNDPIRKQVKYNVTRKWPRYKGLPWGGVRIAFRLEAVQKANVWFTQLFGGGALFPSGEDSMFLRKLRNAGLKIYVSKETIGEVFFFESSWFSGFDERYYYGKGAFCQAMYPQIKYLWIFYFAIRTYKREGMNFIKKIKWMYSGTEGYKKLISYDEYIKLAD